MCFSDDDVVVRIALLDKCFYTSFVCAFCFGIWTCGIFSCFLCFVAHISVYMFVNSLEAID